MSLEHSPARQRNRGSAARFDYDLLSFDDVAQRFGCARKTVKQSYRRWGLRPVKIAGKVLFPSDQLIELETRLIKHGEAL